MRATQVDNPNPSSPNPSSPATAELMADLAAGRGDRVFDLAEVARVPLERLVRGTLCRFGRRDLAADRGEVDFLVMTAALVILDRSGGWRPDGSPPWVWARHAIRSAIGAHIGHAVSGDDPAELGEDAGTIMRPQSTRSPGRDSLSEVVEHDARYRLLMEALAVVAGPRDRAVVLEVIDQKASGDPSPSHTVADLFGLSAVNVRKIYSRVRGRLLSLINSDDRFAPLGAGTWLVDDRKAQGSTTGGAAGIVDDGVALTGERALDAVFGGAGLAA